jgi:hypothetical protein
MKKLLTLVAVVLLGACSLIGQKPIEQAAISISIENQDRIRFSGKGAGAGMMMSSSMGAMGIAIGVAIDEGIAKEIHESFIASGGDFSVIIEFETRSWLSGICRVDELALKPLCGASTELKIRVYHYGMVSTSGDNDPVKAKLEIGFSLDDQKELLLNLKDLDGDQFNVPLDLIKKDGKLAIALLTKSYVVLLNKYENEQKTRKP